MIEDEKKQVAVFRFSVISDFVNGSFLSQSQKNQLMRDKCARKWQIPFSEKTRISKGTIFRWIRLYTASNGDLTSLYPKDRSDQGKSRSLDEDTCLSLIELRLQMPEATVPKIIEEMVLQKRVSPGMALNPSTVYRLLHQVKKKTTTNFNKCPVKQSRAMLRRAQQPSWGGTR